MLLLLCIPAVLAYPRLAGEEEKEEDRSEGTDDGVVEEEEDRSEGTDDGVVEEEEEEESD